MKKLLLLALLCTTMPLLAALQAAADDVLGTWMNPTGEAKIQIFKSGNFYYGKITWLKVPNDPATGQPKLDSKNPDASKRTQPVLGLLILRGFSYKDGEWTDGNIYDPKNGKDYSCIMSMPDNNTLNIRGYIGVSMLGRTESWKRVKE